MSLLPSIANPSELRELLGMNRQAQINLPKYIRKQTRAIAVKIRVGIAKNSKNVCFQSRVEPLQLL
jgi:hypothetical protein